MDRVSTYLELWYFNLMCLEIVRIACFSCKYNLFSSNNTMKFSNHVSTACSGYKSMPEGRASIIRVQ